MQQGRPLAVRRGCGRQVGISPPSLAKTRCGPIRKSPAWRQTGAISWLGALPGDKEEENRVLQSYRQSRPHAQLCAALSRVLSDLRAPTDAHGIRSTGVVEFCAPYGCTSPYIPCVKPRTKFLIGGVLVIATAGYLAASAIKDTGVYYLTPGELSAKTKSDPTFYETGVKV